MLKAGMWVCVGQLCAAWRAVAGGHDDIDTVLHALL